MNKYQRQRLTQLSDLLIMNKITKLEYKEYEYFMQLLIQEIVIKGDTPEQLKLSSNRL